MVLGKTGVGKSATINSIFDEVKFRTDAFQLGTKKGQDVVGTVQGIKVRVIDTPGLLPFWADQRKNQKILRSVKKFIQKSPPDIVLYLDRLDMQSRDDIPILRTITDIFGQSIWFNAIVVLTHAASAPPEGPNGTATSYDMFVTQRSHVVQQAIRQAAGDMRLMNPVSLVENHSACRTNRNGQRVLPNGQVWKPHLLLLSFASKILVEANMLLKLQDSPPGKPFAARSRAPPLPYILSTLLQSRPQMKLPQEQFGDDNDDALDDDIDESSDEESSEYDEFPPFKRLTNAHVSKLSKEEKKSYYDELEYREKLFMKKQLKEEKKRRKMMKKMAEAAKIFPTELTDNNVEEDNNHTHRYRVLDSANQWLIRPVLDPHGWDHDVGYEGINVEHLLALKEKIPVSFSGHVTKDKKYANLQMEVSSAMKHGKSKSTTIAFDMQTFGKEMSYSLRSETRFISYRKNKASAGLSATYFGDTLTGGVKFEDKLMINKRGELVVAEGAVIAHGDVAYEGSLEATLRDKDFPLGRFLSTIGLAWRSCTFVECSVPDSYWILVSCIWHHYLEIEESYVVYAAGLQPVDAQHDLQSTIDEVDLDHILQIIHVYLQELGIDEIRRRLTYLLYYKTQAELYLRLQRSISEEEIAGLKQTFEMIDADIGHITTFPSDMSPRNRCHRGTNFLTEKYVRPTVSLRIVAGERIPVEHSPANIPQRQVAREGYPERQVTRESPEMSLGNMVNVVVSVTLTPTIKEDDNSHICNGKDVNEEAYKSVLRKRNIRRLGGE
ncbi:translocase of chloroplast 120, chloroplastic-like protein [Tanacetum coccineum]